MSYAQRRIQAILKTQIQEPTEAHQVLQQHARRSVKELSASDFDPTRNARLCCFSLASRPAAWTCRRLCTRCKAVYTLMYGMSSGNPINKAILASSLIATDCKHARTTGRGIALPELPAEILDMIVDYAVAGMDGSVLCALMHTTCWIRYKVIRAYPALRISETAAKRSKEGPISFSRPFVNYTWELVEYLLSDFATKRHKKKPVYSDFGFGVEVSPEWLLCNVLCQIKMVASSSRPFKTNSANTKEEDATHLLDSAWDTVVCEVLARFLDPTDGANPVHRRPLAAPRQISIFQLALDRQSDSEGDDPDGIARCSANIDVNMEFNLCWYSAEGEDVPTLDCAKVWRFLAVQPDVKK